MFGHGAFVKPFAEPMGGAGVVVNPLAAVPWSAQFKFNGDGNDSVGSNNLTNNNTATFTTGKIGGATGATQVASASSQFWSHTDAAAFRNDAGDFSVSVWVYADSNGSYPAGIVCKGAASGVDREWWLDWNNGAPLWVVWTADALKTATWGATLSFATWYLITCYYDSAAQTIGIAVNNGTPVVMTGVTGTPHAGTEVVNVGHRDGTYFNGRIDNLLIAKGAGAKLSAAQLTALYNGGNGTETIT